MEDLGNGYIKFKCKITNETFYNSDSNWGVYQFCTPEQKLQYCTWKENPFGESCNYGTLAGNVQQLYPGSEYEVVAKAEFNAKYKQYQYAPKSVISSVPKTITQQKEFLTTLITSTQADTLLAEYPNIVNEIINGTDKIDYSKLKGIKEKTYSKIRDSVLKNYVISDILVLLQPLGITYKAITKIMKTESNPVLLKEKILENPYELLLHVSGFGWQKTDNAALKINPELKCSSARMYAFIKYYLSESGENDGNTWITIEELRKAVIDNFQGATQLFNEIIENERKNEVVFHFSKDGERIGFLKYYKYEQEIFESLINLAKCEPLNIEETDILKGIKKANAEQGFELNPDQIEVIRASLKNNVFLLTGKAGTSKTTTSRAILNIYSQAGYSISCCAFSAKAAQRITEATGFEASTIHRLLRYNPATNSFNVNETSPLETNIVFVDEASMINVDIFYHLVKAVAPGTKLIICGDDGQLPPIGCGNIFSDILKKKDYFLIEKLTKVLRQAEDSGILHDANMIRAGHNPIEKPSAKQITGVLQDMTYMFRDDPEMLRNIAIKSYMAAIQQVGIDDVTIIIPRRDNCCNCSNEVNNIINEMYIADKSKKLIYGNKKYYVGSKIIQIKNDYDKNVFNGETGYVREIKEEIDSERKSKIFILVAEFIMNNESKFITYKQDEINELELGYALTVHKMQGSSSHTIIVIIDNSHYTLLDSCILYTALTRAKKRCLLLAQPGAFKRCIFNSKSKERQTWIKIFK